MGLTKESSCISILSDISITENGVLGNEQIKNCSVVLEKISDKDLKKYLRRNNISEKQGKTPSTRLSRSKRLRILSKRQYLDSDVLDHEQNIPSHKKKMARKKFIDSDDDYDFFGFEFPENNESRTYILKNKLRKLYAYTKKLESEKKKIVKKGSQKHPRQTSSSKANNITEQMFIAPDERMHKEQPFNDFSSCAGGSSIGNEISIGHKFEDKYTNDKSLSVLEMLKSYKDSEKKELLMNKEVQGMVQNLRTRKSVDGEYSNRPLDYYDSDNYIVKRGRQVPLRGEENMTSAIMSCEEKIPAHIISCYFYNPQPVTMDDLFGSASGPQCDP